MALGADKVAVLRVASMMHDVGKIGIPDHILLKPGKLSAQEFDTMKKHTLIGKDILTGSSTDLLRVSETIALNHHERYDGQGYPKGPRGEEIPLASRIVTVADVYDAITSQRVYKPALGHEKACGVLRENAGGQFDPQVVEAFFDVIPEVRLLTEGENYSPGHEAGKRATTLLLVDREGSKRNRVALFLSQQGHTVKTASGGKEALAAMAREGINLVILNPHLPGMDGYEVLSVMKGVKEWKYTPVIVLSDPGYGDEIALGKAMGADEHLFRPVNLMELHKKVKLLLRSREPLYVT